MSKIINRASIKVLIENNPICKASFIKKDGQVRVMKFTKDFKLIPTNKHPKNKGPQKNLTEGSETVFDLEKNGWRVLNLNTVSWIETIYDNNNTLYFVDKVPKNLKKENSNVRSKK